MNIIVKRINELRVKQGLSQAALADAIGVNVNSIYNWNRTETAMPSLKNLESLCKVFSITIEQFFNGIDGENGNSSERKFLDEWRMLTAAEKLAVEKVIAAFKETKAVQNV